MIIVDENSPLDDKITYAIVVAATLVPLGPGELREDRDQEAMLGLLSAEETWKKDAGSKWTTWVYFRVRQRMAYWRKHNLHLMSKWHANDGIPARVSMELALDKIGSRIDEHDHLLENTCRSALNEEQWIAIALSSGYHDGKRWTYSEIARAVGVTRKTVARWASDARTILKPMLANEYNFHLVEEESCKS